MGVSGCGKTTIGRLLAERLGVSFLDGDDFHPPENTARMRAGLPLEDSHRQPWLERLAAELAGRDGVVLACSALKARYRAILAGRGAKPVFIHLSAPPEVIAARLAKRQGHFMPASLLDSQFATLEPPSGAITVDAAAPPESVLAAILYRLGCLADEEWSIVSPPAAPSPDT